MNLRFIDWVWRIRGGVPLLPALSAGEAFDRLDPLFQERGTTYSRDGDVLVFQKKSQGAQDKMSVFDHGVLAVENGAKGLRLRYDLVSKTLLMCFLAPFLFLGFAEFFDYTNAHHHDASTPAIVKGKDDTAAKASGHDAPPKPKAVVPMNSIDKFLGAPKPAENKDADKKPADKHKKLSTTPAYIFAGIFATLYVMGRILEHFLIRRVFIRHLIGIPVSASPHLVEQQA